MTDSRRVARYAKLVNHDDVFAWLACGWMVHRDDAGWYPCNDDRLGQYGTLLVWLCDCDMRRPVGADQQIPAPGYGALTGPIDRSGNASHGLAGRPTKFPRAGAEQTPAPSTKPIASLGSAALGPNSGFDSRDGGHEILADMKKIVANIEADLQAVDDLVEKRRLREETQRDYDEEGLYGWSINRRSAL